MVNIVILVIYASVYILTAVVFGLFLRSYIVVPIIITLEVFSFLTVNLAARSLSLVQEYPVLIEVVISGFVIPGVSAVAGTYAIKILRRQKMRDRFLSSDGV